MRTRSSGKRVCNAPGITGDIITQHGGQQLRAMFPGFSENNVQKTLERAWASGLLSKHGSGPVRTVYSFIQQPQQAMQAMQTVQQQPVYQQHALWVEYRDTEGRLYYWNTQTKWAQYDAPVLQPQLQQQVGGGGGYGKASGQGESRRFAPY
jgi:hypothetical protein